MRHVHGRRLWIALAPAFIGFGWLLSTALAGQKPGSEQISGLPNDAVIEYGTVTVEAKWAGDQTRGSASVSFKTEFAEPPMIVANQYGRDGWHFFVHATATKTTAGFNVMLDRSYAGKEPRSHPCQIAYIAVGKRAKP